MKLQRITAAAAALLAVSFATAGAIADDEVEFEAKLRKSEEVPPVVAEARTSGLYRVKVKFPDVGPATAEFELSVRRGERLTQAHLHCAPAGSNGPVVAFLAGFHALGWDVNGRWIDNTTLTDANIVVGSTPSATCPMTIATLEDLVVAMEEGLIYANVHNLEFPGGVVRGQLVKDD